MCGLAGAVWSKPREIDALAVAGSMQDAIRHRGPDSRGHWMDSNVGVLLAHVRLSIVELSPAGHQPMISACGRYVLVFNGEIYNHGELRQALCAAPIFRGHSDTETLLACFAEWGIERTLQAAVGMFAFALWDRDTQTLTLGRDRLGEKPLYYGWQDDVLLFASELNAICAWPGVSPELNRNALTLYMRHGFIPAPHSIWQGIVKLPPGCWVQFDAQSRQQRLFPPAHAYWSLPAVWSAGKASPLVVSDEQAVDQLEQLLMQAVQGQMLADVPLGAFLSGGVDSSTIVALMQASASRSVKTFSIGFDDPQYNEAGFAKAVAAHLGTEHHELYVSGADAMAAIERLPHCYDEPFADSSQIPSMLVAQLASQSVTVALSGDGGDELFAGYSRYAQTAYLRQRLQGLPRLARLAAQGGGALLQPALSWAGQYSSRASALSGQLDKLRILLAADDQAFYQAQISYCQHPSRWVLDAQEPAYGLNTLSTLPQACSFSEKMTGWDMLNYLPDDILTKVDRACMGVGLESRVPLLDHRVVEFACHLPMQFKVRQAQRKWVLRQVLYRHVPQALIERPKKGFSAPVRQWLCGPLRDWVETLLDAQRLRQEGVFHVGNVRRAWRDCLAGQGSQHHLLWHVVVFQAWRAHFLRSR